MINAPYTSQMQELFTACDTGNLARVNELLEIPGILAEATAIGNYALSTAVVHGHLKVVNRLLEIPAVLNLVENDKDILLKAIWERSGAEIVNRLLQIPGILNNASSYLLAWATRERHLEIIIRLLKAPAIRANLESKTRENFVTFYKRILSIINYRAPLVESFDENEKPIIVRSRAPVEFEIDAVNILRDIASKNNFLYIDFNDDEMSALKFARRIHGRLYSRLQSSLLTSLLEEPAPELLTLYDNYDAAAPSTSSAAFSSAKRECGSEPEGMEPAKRFRAD